MSFVEAEGIRKTYSSLVAVEKLSLKCDRGESIGLLGPNGAGKTTTLNILAGVLPPDEGRVTIDGQALYPTGKARNPASIGFCPQARAIYPDLTVEENFSFWGRLCGLEEKRLKERIDELYVLFELGPAKDQLVRTLSGGSQQKLNLALALLHSPLLLILDEPVTGLDMDSRRRVLAYLRQLVEAGTTLIYASHYLEEIRTTCHRVAVLQDGHLITTGSVDALLNSDCGVLEIVVRGHQPPRFEGVATDLQIVETDSLDAAHYRLAVDCSVREGESRLARLLQASSEIIRQLEGANQPVVSLRFSAPTNEELWQRLR